MSKERIKGALLVAGPLLFGLGLVVYSMNPSWGSDIARIVGIVVIVLTMILIFGFPVEAQEFGDDEIDEEISYPPIDDPDYVDAEALRHVDNTKKLVNSDSLKEFIQTYAEEVEPGEDRPMNQLLIARFEQLRHQAARAHRENTINQIKAEKAKGYFWRMIVGSYVLAFGSLFGLLLIPFVSEIEPQTNNEPRQSYLVKGCVFEPRRTGIPNVLYEDRELGKEFEALAGEKSELDCSKGSQWLFNFGGEIVNECRPGGFCGDPQKDSAVLPDDIPKISHLYKEVLDESFCDGMKEEEASRCEQLVSKHEDYVQRLNKLKGQIQNQKPDYTSMITQQFHYVSAWLSQYQLKLAIVQGEIELLERKHQASTDSLENAVGSKAAIKAREQFRKWDEELEKKQEEEARLELYTKRLEDRLAKIESQINAVGFATGNVITGGLTVPYYFILLALFGGVVNLARRVPEYHWLKIPESETKMDPRQAREQLIFQVIQFLSAPLIAVFAYSLVIPEQFATTVVLGFISGFASQPLLIFLRQAGERLVGSPKPAT